VSLNEKQQQVYDVVMQTLDAMIEAAEKQHLELEEKRLRPKPSIFQRLRWWGK